MVATGKTRAGLPSGRKLPRGKRGLPPDELESWLKSDARESLDRSFIEKELRRLNKESAKMGADMPSSTWLRNWEAGDHLHRRIPFPPPSEHSPMLRCCACGRIHPQSAMSPSRLFCEDCEADTALMFTERFARTGRDAFNRLYPMILAKLRTFQLIDDEIAAMSLYFFEGYSMRAVAQSKNQSLGWVHKLIKSGLKKLEGSGISLPRPLRRRGRPVVESLAHMGRFANSAAYNA